MAQLLEPHRRRRRERLQAAFAVEDDEARTCFLDGAPRRGDEQRSPEALGERWGVLDMLGFMRQLGAVPAAV